MKLSYLTALIAVPLLATGCATVRGAAPGDELVGRTLRMQTTNGQVTTLQFRGNGTVHAAFGSGSLEGRWDVEDRSLCFFWPRAPRECWPYRAPFERGRTRSVTSDRGNVLRVTLL